MPPLWAGEPDGDKHLPGVRCDSQRRITPVWQGSSAERDGSATEYPDDSAVHRTKVEARHQPAGCGAGRGSRDSGCS